MNVRFVQPYEIKDYLTEYYTRSKVQNPSKYVESKLKDYSSEDLVELAGMFRVAVDGGVIISGLCLYNESFLQDAWIDENFSGFEHIIYSLMSDNNGLATYLSSFKPSDREKVQFLLESKGWETKTIYDMKCIPFGSLYAEDGATQAWSEDLEQAFQDIYQQNSGEFDFGYEVAKNYIGGKFSPQFWLLDDEGGMAGANHPGDHADNEIIFTIAALYGPEDSKRKLLHTLMAKIYAAYPAAEVFIHAKEEDKALLESVGFEVRDRQKLITWVSSAAL